MNHSNCFSTQPHCVGWLLMALALMMPSLALATSEEWHFEVLLDDKPIGNHIFQLKQQGDTHLLNSQAEFDVKFLFFSAYNYSHKSEETWEKNCLNSITSSTDDNGKLYTVRGMRQDDEFLVETQNERSTLPACPMSFAYWNPQILDESWLLNSQTGEYVPVRVRNLGEAPFETQGKMVRADRYQIEAKDMHIELWYSKQGRWLALESATDRGGTIRYRLTDTPSIAKQQTPWPGDSS